ncbi:MAG: RNB domain-containing ribonuclease, partial [Polyangiaceae bacterium]
WFQEKNLPTVYRVHAPPDEQKLERFARLTEALGIEFEVEHAQDPKKVSELLKGFADHPQANVLRMLLLRSLKQATYDVVNIGHFGLASKAYLHFTSPIRRYPDLLVHRGTHAVVLGKRRPPSEQEMLAEAAKRSSENERRAMDIEREVVDIYRCVFMRDRIGERYEGTVTGLVGTGAYVMLDDPFVDVMVRFEDLGDRYELDDDGISAVSERTRDVIRLGDRMMVEILDAAIVRRTVYAKRVGHTTTGKDGRKDLSRRQRRGGEKPRGRDDRFGGKTDSRKADGRKDKNGKAAHASSKKGKSKGPKRGKRR